MSTAQKVRKVRKAETGRVERIGWVVYANGQYRNQFKDEAAAACDAEMWYDDGFEVEIRELWVAVPR